MNHTTTPVAMHTVTRTPASTYSPEMAEVHVALPGAGSARVTIYGPQAKFGDFSPAQVNWSAIGSVSAADALAYAGAIALAAAIAPTLAPATGKVEVDA